jgi:sugar O-acyltransferase (sialic acid O-acetyltransferase NeuD family)
MDEPLYGVFGFGGFGREIMPLARQQLRANGVGTERLVFVDDARGEPIVNGQTVVTYDGFLAIPASSRHVALGIGSGEVRERVAARCNSDGIAFFELIAGNVVIMDGVSIGEGAVLSPFVTLTSNIVVGKQFQANIYSYVAHDCRIGDYVTLAPGAKCNGNVVIEDYAYVGTGAVIRQGKPGAPLVIGKGAVIGMGAVVTKDVPAGATVVGNPARPLVKG